MARALSLIPTVCAISMICGCERASVKQTSDLELISLKAKCRDDGEKVRSKWKKTYYQDVFSDEPEYAYNPSLKTCLWLGEYRGPSVDKDSTSGKLKAVQTHVKFILDVYTNKTLIEYTEHDGQQIGDVSEGEFKQRQRALFNAR